MQSSDVLFGSSLGLGLVITANFSCKCKRHVVDIFEYAGAHLKTDQLKFVLFI